MKKKYMAILLALSMVFASQSFGVAVLAEEGDARETENIDDGEEGDGDADDADQGDDEQDQDDDGEDPGEITDETPAPAAQAAAPTEGFEGGSEVVSEMVLEHSEEDVSDDGDASAEDGRFVGVVPTITDEADVIRGIFPTYSPEYEEERTVEEESEETAVGISSVPDAETISLRPDDVIAMVMPVMTNEMYDYTIDPFDLLARYGRDADSYDGSSLYFKNSGEELTYSGMSDPAIAKNKSSVPVFMYVTVSMDNISNWPVHFTDMDDVKKNDENNVAFSIVPVSEEDGKKVYHTDRSVGIDKEGRAQAVFYLDGSPDSFMEYEGGLIPRPDADFATLGFSIAGASNPKGDWTEIMAGSSNGENMKLVVSCRLKPLSLDDRDAIDSGKYVYDKKSGLVDMSGKGFDKKSKKDMDDEDKSEKEDKEDEDDKSVSGNSAAE